ncbi:MAG: hypothetical protein ABEI52_01705, partial [Halobacteriaceae archaeon]
MVWVELMASGSVDIDYNAQREAITSAIDESGTALVCLYTAPDAAEQAGHAVLAYDYEQVNGRTKVYIYDNNATGTGNAVGGQGGPTGLYFITFDGQGGIEEINTVGGDSEGGITYTRAFYTPADGDVDLENMIEGDLSAAATFLDGITAFFTRSPVTLSVTANGEPLTELNPPNRSRKPTEYEGLVFDLGQPADTYDVSLKGTGDGEYTLEAYAANDDEAVLEEKVDGQINQGTTHTFSATTSENSKEQSLARTDVGISLPGGIQVPSLGGSTILEEALIGAGVLGVAGGGYALYRWKGPTGQSRGSTG